MKFGRQTLLVFPVLLLTAFLSHAAAPPAFNVRANYTKTEAQIPMRDGVRLFTSIYAPRDTSQKFPIMLSRTPYTVSPYGAEAYRGSLGPSDRFAREGYIFVYQDVRGRYMSEGQFVHVRPHREVKRSQWDIDESTDTYDTIEWLVKNVPNNNGKVGLWGISYPGFYVSAGIIDSHPALVAASPQAPIADWFIGDDFHHNGAFFMMDGFNWLSGNDRPRPQPATTRSDAPWDFSKLNDAYDFFLQLGALPNANARHFQEKLAFWNECMRHPNYDAWWKARNLLPHLRNVRCAVMTVGGWFDAEDLHGPLKTYSHIERMNSGIHNSLVVGPWVHGGWSRSDGDRLGDIAFGAKTAQHYRENVEFPFFDFHLKGKGQNPPEALTFMTGANQWKPFESWPPRNTKRAALHLRAGGKLSWEAPSAKEPTAFDEYLSDPAKPVPYSPGVTYRRNNAYMIEDQRFAAMRPDVLVYQTEPLAEEMTLAGPLRASLFVSSTGTDADFVAKLIDVLPADAPDPEPNPNNARMGNYQMLVRAEVMRARFRDGFESPQPLRPGKVERVPFELQDVCHTFKKGHRIMVQVQSSWFPLVDRNPQKFVPSIYQANERDFVKATQRVWHTQAHASRVSVGVLTR